VRRGIPCPSRHGEDVNKDRDELYSHLQTLIATHEAQFANPWPFDLPMDYIENMMKGLVGFSLEITRLEGKFKMSQNRSESERTRVSAELRASEDVTLCAVAELVSGDRKRE
jgi:transcriptional regulator